MKSLPAKHRSIDRGEFPNPSFPEETLEGWSKKMGLKNVEVF